MPTRICNGKKDLCGYLPTLVRKELIYGWYLIGFQTHFSRKQSLKRKDVIFVRGITTRDHLYHDFEDTVYMVPNIVSCITRKLKSTILYMYRKELVKMVTLTTYFKTTEIDEEVTHSVHQKLNDKLNLISNLRK